MSSFTTQSRSQMDTFGMTMIDEVTNSEPTADDLEPMGPPPVTRLEDCLTEHVVEPGTRAEDGTISGRVVQHLVRVHGKAVKHLVVMAKLQFKGMPKPTMANQMVVWQYLANQCEKKGINPTDAHRIITCAVPYVFLPCELDVEAARMTHSAETSQLLGRYAAQFIAETPLHQLYENPLSGKAWWRYMKSVLSGETSLSLDFTK